MVQVNGQARLDLRANDRPVELSLDFQVPYKPLPKDLRQKLLQPERWPKGLLSREKLRKLYGTKLSAGYQTHLLALCEQHGSELEVLDLGCGSGGNRTYLADIGLHRVTGVDWWSKDADFLADAHRLPFSSNSFDIVLCTAVLEHCYLPHLVMREVARVLKPGGTLLMGASFWEAWHGESYFHFTPNGIFALCQQAGLQLEDLWSGWGFIPAVMSYALNWRLKRIGYLLQIPWDLLMRLLLGEKKAYLRKIRTSGSLQFRADLET
jgi:SAM-dependent methyltransferase